MKKVFIIAAVVIAAVLLFLLLLFGLPALRQFHLPPIKPILLKGGDALWRLLL